MEVVYDSEVNIKPSSGTQCIPHAHRHNAEPCQMAQVAPGTPTHDSSVEHHTTEDLTTVTTAESNHPLASAFVMQSSDVKDGEGSSSSNMTSKISLSLKRNASTVGLAWHLMVSTGTPRNVLCIDAISLIQAHYLSRFRESCLE